MAEMHNEDFLERDEAAERLADAAPWSTANNDPNLPEIAFEFECIDVAAQMSAGQNGKVAKLMIVTALEVVLPVEFAGRRKTERYVIGDDKDPEARKPNMWDAGTTMGSTSLAKLKVVTESMQSWRDIKGKRFVAQVQHSPSDDGGIVYANLVNYAKVGEMSPGKETPPRQFNKKRRGPGSGLSSDIAPSGDVLVACMNCNAPFPQAEVAEHMATCSGIPF